jgi:hypothetical protein
MTTFLQCSTRSLFPGTVTRLYVQNISIRSSLLNPHCKVPPEPDVRPATRFLSRFDKSATNIKESQLFVTIGQVCRNFHFMQCLILHPLAGALGAWLFQMVSPISKISPRGVTSRIVAVRVHAHRPGNLAHRPEVDYLAVENIQNGLG